MLRDFVDQLCKELSVRPPKWNEKKVCAFRLTKEIEVMLRDLDPGVGMQGKICPVPKKKKEEIFIYLMRANVLGQGTGGSSIGIDADEKFLTLSLGLPYELNYKMFKESVEDFVNYLIYWRDEVARLDCEETVY
jgi:hypothetical protein